MAHHTFECVDNEPCSVLYVCCDADENTCNDIVYNNWRVHYTIGDLLRHVEDHKATFGGYE